MKWLRIFVSIALFLVLTAFSQVGGIIYWLCFPLFRLINRKMVKGWKRRLAKVGGFVSVYLLLTFILIPILAGMFGRVPLPIYSGEHLQPLNIFTALLNRHYVRPELKEVLVNASENMEQQFPGSKIAYLDANFPFINGFPLPPHLSHVDGKKVDVAFFYTDAESGEQLHLNAPSFIGYGVFEAPKTGEYNMPNTCAAKGNWLYSAIRYFVPQWNKDAMIFDQQRTKALTNLFAADPAVGKIFLEPHLKTRMTLSSGKVRFHGCGAVRHDDHLHVQLK